MTVTTVRRLSQNVPMPRAWLLLLLIFIGGCGEKLQQVGGQLRRPVSSIVSLSPSTTEIIAHVDTNALKGRTASCNYPDYVKGMPVFAGVKPDYEKLALAKPDLVVYDANLYSPADDAKLQSLHIRTYRIHATTVDEFESQLRGLGDAIGMPREVSEYIDKVESERNTALSQAPGSKPKVAIFTGNLIAGTKSFAADVVRTCGGEPVGPDADRFVANNPESLIQENPDLIILATDISGLKDSGKKRDAMMKVANTFAADPRYKSITAIKSGNVAPMDADVLLRQGYRVDLFIRSVAELIHGVAK
jgi:iron complex transport system substrate-binding protein